ncbi:MAG: cation-efflux pump [Clostridia bacterium]|nr:cation-efflux pump [Clostridia bacterium]
MSGEKQRVAFTSVIAAVFLTVIKIVIGAATGSLGIMAEAAHSALDMGAAVVTFFAVRMADKPADMEHNYGHGKIESFSALIETALLLITCGWIMYEAAERLLLGKAAPIDTIEATWGVGIMVLSIVINISRARALKKVAKKYGSQALEADALHFDSDVWSSLVVIGGLICVAAGDYFGIAALDFGDPVAALGVSVLVIVVSMKLGKRTIDVLLDTAPKGMVNTILHEVNDIKGILDVASVRVRPSGPNYFIDINVGINRNESHRVVHCIVDEVRERLQNKIPNSDIVIGTFPVDMAGAEDREVYHAVKRIVDKFPVCTNIHNIHIYEVSGKKYISVHIEVRETMSLKDSHELSHDISKKIQESIENIEDVSVNFEYVKQRHIVAEDITESSKNLIEEIECLLNKAPDKLNCHDIRVYRGGDRITIFLHCEMCSSYTTEKTEVITKNISNKIRKTFDNIESVHIHVEPID